MVFYLIHQRKLHVQRLIENQGPNFDEEYMFFDGEFDCQLWISKLEFYNSYFDTARCSQANNTESNLQSFKPVGIFLSFMSIVIALIDKMNSSYFIVRTIFWYLT